MCLIHITISSSSVILNAWWGRLLRVCNGLKEQIGQTPKQGENNF